MVQFSLAQVVHYSLALTTIGAYIRKDLNSNDYQNEEDLNSKANANEELESVTNNQHQDL